MSELKNDDLCCDIGRKATFSLDVTCRCAYDCKGATRSNYSSVQVECASRWTSNNIIEARVFIYVTAVRTLRPEPRERIAGLFNHSFTHPGMWDMALRARHLQTLP